QPHNASAVLRTAECFGIQNIHIIENKNTYKVNPDVALGAEKWINIFKYNSFENNTSGCLTQLKQEGYKIVATSPYKKGYTLNELPLDTPLAIIFGNELNGLSNIAIQQSDDFLQIPMFGFTESFNISVSVAIIISHLIEKLHSSSYNWQLNEEEKIDILIQWVKNTIKKPQLLEENFLKTYNK
ncbi:MAG TPA: RNA methyltransferase, partial [Bacteroidales bacterium]|nr:RNA methyltransferase [Bacteroidales bacterium]